MAINISSLHTLLPFTVDAVYYTRRKSIALSISGKGELIVRVPIGTSDRALVDALMNKRGWITKHQQNAIDSIAKNNRQYLSKEIFYLGDTYKIVVNEDKENCVKVLDNIVYVHHNNKTQPRYVVLGWYHCQAENLISSIVYDYCELLGLRELKISITSAKTRWGSCNYRIKRLNFSWRLIMAPKPVVEYVVLHEIMHLKVPNHSKLFWDELAELCPEYREYKLWLRQNSRLMSLDHSLILGYPS